MLDSGARAAAAFLPAGVPILVGLVVAVMRRRAMPAISAPAIAGLLLQMVVVVLSTVLVAGDAAIGALGLSDDAIRTLGAVLGLAVIVMQVVSWTLILVALFRRL